MRFIRFLSFALLAVFLVACGKTAEDVHPNVETISMESALATQQKLSETINLDISTVYVLKLMVDGELVDVASVAPSVVGKTGEGENAAMTIMAFSQDRNQVALFTRDPATKEGYQLVFPREEMTTGFHFVFPIVKDDQIHYADIVVESILKKP